MVYAIKEEISDWNDGQPATELNFRFYRRDINKIGGISDGVAAFLSEFFLERVVPRFPISTHPKGGSFETCFCIACRHVFFE